MKHQPRKRFGQNFLHDQTIIDAIISSVNAKPNQCIVEIGPGHGALTYPLLKQARALTVIEIDRDLVEKLETQNLEDLTIVSADALKLDFSTLYQSKPLRIVGNLPYNISTPLLLRFVEAHEIINDITVMLQQEVIDRLVATPGNKTFGRLSVLMQSVFNVEKIVSVPPAAFRPAPKVQSAVVRLAPHRKWHLTGDELKKLQRLTQLAFANKRKTLRNNLSKHINTEAIEALGIDPGRRAETLSLEEFHALNKLL
ncbi:MAG: 16S rRNA (adenine(1518)-N(6)/adenine(1519)-N(6))-dimethyltransferase RsmA [Gammaproteobacteria bacterium]|nr:16S rRNA (adenine(1518)-N(6)/adenine(1519)-N(6))-dimethyltransferase RsmA [Gammaproteobacteria bacterium]